MERDGCVDGLVERDGCIDSTTDGCVDGLVESEGTELTEGINVGMELIEGINVTFWASATAANTTTFLTSEAIICSSCL